MPVSWMDVSGLSFNTLLLLERVQLSWFPGWVPEAELARALHANPGVEWYLDDPEAEQREMVRVTRPGGLVILCLGNNDRDDERHSFLVSEGFAWSRFEEPGAGMMRKYWQRVTAPGG